MNYRDVCSRGSWKGRIARKTALLLFALLTSGLTGCKSSKKTAQELVKAGSTTADELAKFYDDLAEKRAEHLRIDSAIRFGVTSTPVPEPLRQEFAKQQEALEARAELARKFKGMYDALGKLIDYDAAGEVSKAVTELKDQIVAVNSNHPLRFGNLSADLSSKILDGVVKYLVELEQMKQFRKHVPKTLDVLNGILEFYDVEKFIYVQIAQDYDIKTYNAAKFLVDKNLAVNASVFQKPIEIYGLTVYEIATDNLDLRNATLRLLEEKKMSLMQASQKRADKHSVALYRLEHTTRTFLKLLPEYPHFKAGEIKDVAGLVKLLQDALKRIEMGQPSSVPRDQVTEYIASLLTSEAKKQVKEFNNSTAQAKELEKTLVVELNRVVENAGLYKKERFPILSSETQRLIEVTVTVDGQPKVYPLNPTGKARVTLNRRLLEETYPNEIGKL